eukprot:CAMPEP_0194225498 /NCGR_PEP_ID=MMETSP0156-20130528/39712_1 /TAXON_ID=33649 /ORGANISM="Thalassionema nitzschioides, Strain L26-B" /LENGTH=510 /DNA_ID=CAMNT_0038957453 /DNA_START=87 /DNA_END=1620 /DNA_ORIENTATION=+
MDDVPNCEKGCFFDQVKRDTIKPLGHIGSNDGNQFESENKTSFRPSSMKVLKASMLIAGTTVGGGFLALPQTVVFPLGSFRVTAISLLGVWIYFLSQSFVLVDCFVEYHKISANRMNQTTIGIPLLANHTLGSKGYFSATSLLVVLTEATLVSQISRAGSLLADNAVSFFGIRADRMLNYRVGCVIATVIGACISFGGRESKQVDTKSDPEFPNLGGNNLDDSRKVTGSLTADVNAILTGIFLISAFTLFQAGRLEADWSRCLASSSSARPLILSIVRAIPTILQLLAYGEILPNVCSMLQYHRNTIRIAVIIGSAIPLILLSGWGALGLALVSTNAAMHGAHDPVNVLIANGGGPIRTRLLVLAASAIGTTILGSYLALESAYDDVIFKEKSVENTSVSSPGQYWLKVVAIVFPPLMISAISPSVFLQAIDFAGSYPVLLLWGVLPPLMALRMRMKGPEDSSLMKSSDWDQLHKHKKRRLWYFLLALFSSMLVGMNGLKNISAVVRFLH